MSVIGTVAAAATFVITGGNLQATALAYSIGSGVDGMVNAPDRIGPRLEDLRVQLSQYGATIPFEWGCNRHAGTIIWPRLLEAIEHRHEESAKGGPDNVSYTYTLSCAVLICEGPIAGVRRIWANKKLIYDVTAEADRPEGFWETVKAIIGQKDPAIGQIRFHLGTEDQAMDPLIEAKDGPGPAYRGFAYAVFEDYDVTELGGRPPQWEFEVIANGDAAVEPSTTFGEARNLGGGGFTFDADMDPNGHIWLHTLSGHAWVNPVTGALEISEGAPSKPQVHEYDARTGALLWYYDVPPITEYVGGNGDFNIVYPIHGKGVCSGGFYFIGRGQPGNGTTDGSYVHGLAVNTSTHDVLYFSDQCSSGQFQNSFYWPSVPVPVIDNNKVYFASGNGVESQLGVGFRPKTVLGTASSPGYNPVPDRTGPEPIWSVPVGWWQARVDGRCPPPEVGFDGVGLALPGVAIKSTMIHAPDGVIVQGYVSGGSYVTMVTHAPIVTDFDLSAPSSVLTCVIPGDQVAIPCVAWDPDNGVLWAFGGDSGDNSKLYAMTPGAGALNLEFTGFTFPAVEGQSQGADVKGMVFDEASGYLRLLLGGGFDNDVRLILFDPVSKSIVEDRVIESNLASTTGKLWNLPDQNKVVYSNGFALYDIPYAPSLSPDGVPLSTIVSDICRRAGLESEDIDVSDLTDIVDGYIVPRQMTARAAIEPLQQAFFFDAVESDDKIKFVKRGKSTATLIPIEHRAAHENGQSIPDALTVTRAFELELPVQCDIEYPDIEADHLIGNQSDRRITKDTRHNLNLQIPVVMTAAKAKAIARTLLYEAWQNQSFRFTTTRKYSYLEPTDLVELPTKAAMYRGRITNRRDLPSGIIEWEARVESVSVYTQTGEGAVPITYPVQQIFVPTPTQLALMDIPLLRDEDDNAGFYVAMGAL